MIVTAGVSEAIQFLAGALVDAGSEFLLPGPSYPPYISYVKFFGGKPVAYRTDEENDWNPDTDDLRSKITDKTVAILVINPNNPTGSVYNEKTLKEIVNIAGSTAARDLLLSPTWLATASADASWPFVALIVLLVPTIAVSMTLFSALWLLLETGLVYNTKNEQYSGSEPVETRSVGGWFMSILRGYAGVGAIFGFYTFAMTSLSLGTVHISVPMLLIPMPLILMVMTAPGLVVFDVLRQRRSEKTRRLGTRFSG